MRSKVEQDNSERQKKVAQLQDFVARFAAGTRATQVQSSKKQIERLQLTDSEAVQHRAPVHSVLGEEAVG